MSRNYTNPFDRYSSRTKRLNYYLPFLGFGKYTKNRGDNEAFIGREDILYRLRNWITNKDKTGSFLVAGYRGMGKSSFVEKALYSITRQRRRSSKIEFVFLLLHLLTMAIVYCILWGISDIWLLRLIICVLFCMLLIFLYVKKYHIGYWRRYLLFVLGLIRYTVSKGKWRTRKSGYNPASWCDCLSECRERLKRLNKEERSRLDKIIFSDCRGKTAQRIHIQINLGHEILKERDILCLIARRIRAEVDGFISNKHLYFWPAYLYILLSCGLTFGVMKQLKGPVYEAIQSVQIQNMKNQEDTSKIRFDDIVNGNTAIMHIEKDSGTGFIQQMYSNTCRFFNELIPEDKNNDKDNDNDNEQNLYSVLFGILGFVCIYLLVRLLIRQTFRFIPGAKQYIWIRKQLNELNDRIHTVIDEETPPVAESTQGVSWTRFSKMLSPNS